MTSKRLVSNPLSWRPDKIVPSGTLIYSQRLVPDNRKMDSGKVQSWVEMESANIIGSEEVDENMQREISRKQMVWCGSQVDLFCQSS
uniref:Uncharacterized protein n=1 Tax=Oryza glumipatula TaxID=40148 RepID=A0A0D9ZDB5_9ORYZ